MSFVKFLQGIGDRLGILETITVSSPAVAVRVQTRIVTLQELAGEIRSGEVCALADSPAELGISFDEIFKTAGIASNPENWTIDRLKRLIDGAPFKNLPHGEIQKKVLDLLSSEGVSAEVIVKDAMARDQALDSFEARVSEKMQGRREAYKKRSLEIELQINDLQAERTRLGEQLEHDEAAWRTWKKLKRAHERELASVASYIIDHPVITTDDEVL
jgi:hypothetical protein